VAEEIVFGSENVTTGAANDIERATQIARNMVTKWGLTEALGPLAYSEDEDEVFLGRSVTQHKHMSDDTARRIDDEVREIVETAHRTAHDLLTGNLEKLELMAQALMRYETIDTEQIDQIMEGREPDPPEDWSEQDSGSGNAAASAAEDEAVPEDPSRIGGPASQH
jgi:cell division protease FtsH